MASIDDIFGDSSTPVAAQASPGPSIDNIFGDATPAPSHPLDNIFKTPVPSPLPTPKMADTSPHFNDFLHVNGLSYQTPDLSGASYSNNTPEPTTKNPIVAKVTGGTSLPQFGKDLLNGLPAASKKVSDAINYPITKAGDLIGNYKPLQSWTQDADTNQGKATAIGLLKGLSDMSGLNALQGATSGAYQAPDLSSDTVPEDTFADTILKTGAQTIGAVLGIGALGEALTPARAAASLGENVGKIPLIGKYLAPYMEPLLKTGVGLSVQTQFDPNLAADMQKRAKTLTQSLAETPFYTALGGIKSTWASVPASFTLGFGMARLSGADNKTALANGALFAVMDGYARSSGERPVMSEAEVQANLQKEARSTLTKFSGHAITDNTTAAELKSAYYVAAHRSHPDVGGTNEAFSAVKNAYDLLSKGKAAPEAEKSISLLKDGIQSSLEKNGELATHQGLQDHLGLDETTSQGLINAAKTPETPAEIKAAHDRITSTILAGRDDTQIKADAIAHATQNKDTLVDKYIQTYGNHVGVDEAKELMPGYSQDRSTSDLVTKGASMVTDAVYDKLLETRTDKGNGIVLVTAGATGVGKSTALHSGGMNTKDYSVVFDTNLTNPKTGIQRIQQAIDAGYTVHLHYTFAPPDVAYDRALLRTEQMVQQQGSGRPVSPQGHIDMHHGSLDALPAILEHFKKALEDGTLRITGFDNSGKEPFQIEKPLDFIREKGNNKEDESKLHDRLQEQRKAAHQEGRISDKTNTAYERAEKLRPQKSRSAALEVSKDGNKESPERPGVLTQKERVADAVKAEPLSIKEIAKLTQILEPNVRRILGVGAKDGTFERVAEGVYVLKTKEGNFAYVETGDAVDTLARMAKEGQKFHSVILDPAYYSRALIGGNRGIKSYGFIMPDDFAKVMQSVSQLVDDQSHVYLMLSGARTAQPDMDKYVAGAVGAGFKVVGEGGFTKLTKDGKPVTNVRGKEAAAERLILITKSGTARAGDIPVELNFRFIRPSIAKSYQTEKPAELMKALIEQSTLKGETVLDPFAGSGVTGAEALKSGRNAVLIEKSEETADNVTRPRVEGAAKQVVKLLHKDAFDGISDREWQRLTTLAEKLGLHVEEGESEGSIISFTSESRARLSQKEAAQIFAGFIDEMGKITMGEYKAIVNSDGTMTEFHGTTPEKADEILKDGFNTTAYLSPSPDEMAGGVGGAMEYGDVVLKVTFDPRGAELNGLGEIKITEENGDTIKKIELWKSASDAGKGSGDTSITTPTSGPSVTPVLREQAAKEDLLKVMTEMNGRASIYKKTGEDEGGNLYEPFIDHEFSNYSEAANFLDKLKPTGDRGFINPGQAAEDIAAGAKKVKDLVTHIEEVRSLTGDVRQGIYQHEGARKAMRIRLTKLVETIGDSLDANGWERLYHYDENKDEALTPEEQKIYDTVILPLKEALSDVVSDYRQAGGTITPDLFFVQEGEYTPRFAKDKQSALDKLIASAKDKYRTIRNGGSLSKSLGTVSKERKFFAATDERGNRKVVYVPTDKSENVLGFDKGKVQELGPVKGSKTPKVNEYFDANVMSRLNTLADDLNIVHQRVPMGQSKGLGKGTAGVSFGGEDLIKTRLSPASVLAHELGHQIDEKYGMQAFMKDERYDAEHKRILNEEMRALADKRFEGQPANKTFKNYVRKSSEKMAVMFEAYVSNKEMFKEVAPHLYDDFRDFLNQHEELRPFLDIQPTVTLGKETHGGEQSGKIGKTFVDKEGNKYTIGQATTKEIEANTNTEYHKNVLANYIVALDRATNALSAMKLLERLKDENEFGEILKKDSPDEAPPQDWKSIGDTMPQFRGYHMEPRLAEALSDLAGRQRGQLYIPVFDEVNNLLTTAIVLNPVMHVPNVVVGRSLAAAAGDFSSHSLKNFGKAFNEVRNKGPLYLKYLEHGAPFMALKDTTKNFSDAIFDQYTDEVEKNPSQWQEISDMLGYANPMKMAEGFKHINEGITWGSNDIFFMHAMMDYRDAHPEKSMEDAIAEVSKRMADYRIPERILLPGKAGRALSYGLQTRAFLFARFHYSGVIKPWIEAARESAGPNSSAKERVIGLRSLAYLLIAGLTAWPYLNKMWQGITGSPSTYESSYGPLKPIEIAKRLAQEGVPGIPRALQSLVTPSPAIRALIELGFNVDLFNHNPIYGPLPAEGLTTYGTSIVSPLASASRMNPEDFALSLFGVWTPKNVDAKTDLNKMKFDELPALQTQVKKDIIAGNTDKADAEMREFNTRAIGTWNRYESETGGTNYIKTEEQKQEFLKEYGIKTPGAVALGNAAAHYGDGSLTNKSSLLNNVATYAKAIGVSPGEAFHLIFSGQSIARVTNFGLFNPDSAIIVKRADLSYTEGIKKDLAAGADMSALQLDHVIPLEAGGTNDRDNLNLITSAQDGGEQQAFEDMLGKAVAAGRISQAKVREFSIRYKIGLGETLPPAYMKEFTDKYDGKTITLQEVQDAIK